MEIIKYYTCYSCGKTYTSFTADKHKTKIVVKNKNKTIKVPVCCDRLLREITKEDFERIEDDFKKNEEEKKWSILKME